MESLLSAKISEGKDWGEALLRGFAHSREKKGRGSTGSVKQGLTYTGDESLIVWRHSLHNISLYSIKPYQIVLIKTEIMQRCWWMILSYFFDDIKHSSQVEIRWRQMKSDEAGEEASRQTIRLVVNKTRFSRSLYFKVKRAYPQCCW